MKEKVKKVVLLTLLSCANLTSCGETKEVIADKVVYSNIYTSNKNHDYVDAFAVKDGKYIYVGNKDGVKKYIKNGTTEIINNENGFVMSGASEGHAHYSMKAVLSQVGALYEAETIDKAIDFIKEKVKKEPNANLYFSFGWQNMKIEGVKATTDVCSLLDEVSTSKPILMVDDASHNVFMNSKAIEMAGLSINSSIPGGFLSKSKDGSKLLGLASDGAMNYVLHKVLQPSGIISADDWYKALNKCEEELHSNGYTMYFDAYTSYFGECAFQGISKYDNEKGLNFYMGGSFEIEPSEDVDAKLNEASKISTTYKTNRFNPNSIKAFADGECVEHLSGWVLKKDGVSPYKDGSVGTQCWEDEKMSDMVKKANQSGLSVHIHASGDAGVKQATDAFINSESTAKDGVLNSIGHARQIDEKTKNKIASHNISVAENICWRIVSKNSLEEMKEKIDMDYYMAGYPMKSLIEKGINVTSSTDCPANSGAPCDVLNIIECAIDGTFAPKLGLRDTYTSLNKNELITLQEAIDVMTINGAKQLGISNERGSIEVGKYADFLTIDNDITKMNSDTIGNANITSVHFEGNKVYTKKQ